MKVALLKKDLGENQALKGSSSFGKRLRRKPKFKMKVAKKVAVLFSGGKDSMYAAWLADKYGYELSCLISIWSKNKESFMFHVPAIEATKLQSERMGKDLVVVKTFGKKEKELVDLEKAIIKAVKKYGIKGVVTGAVESVYQASRIQKICNKLGIECFNPLWQKDQEELVLDLLKNRFEVVVSGVAGYPLDYKWIGRKIDKSFIKDIKKLNEKLGVKLSVAGEGGEFESLVLDCPLFKNKLKVNEIKKVRLDNNYSWKGVFDLK